MLGGQRGPAGSQLIQPWDFRTRIRPVSSLHQTHISSGDLWAHLPPNHQRHREEGKQGRVTFPGQTSGRVRRERFTSNSPAPLVSPTLFLGSLLNTAHIYLFTEEEFQCVQPKRVSCRRFPKVPCFDNTLSYLLKSAANVIV